MRSLKSMGKTKARNSAIVEPSMAEKKGPPRSALLKQTAQDRAIEYIKTGNMDGLRAMTAEGSMESEFLNRFHTKSGMHPLAVAADEYRKEAVEILLEAKADVNLRDKDGFVALHYAAIQGADDIIDLLVVAEADVLILHATTGESAAHFAAKRKHTKTVILLEHRGCPMDIQDVRFETPLSISLKLENFPLCDFLLTHQCNINVTNQILNTPLLLSAFDGCVGTSKYILEHGGDAAHRNMNGESVVMVAVRHGNTRLLAMLLAQTTAPIQAAAGAEVGSVEVHAGKVDVNVRDTTGKTALMHGVMADREDTVSMLLAHPGTQVNTLDTWGFSALMLACISSPANVKIVVNLLERGAEVNAQDKAFNTALIHACKANNLEIANVLLRYGANIHLSNLDNDTAETVLQTKDAKASFRASVSVIQPDSLFDYVDHNHNKPHWVQDLNARKRIG
ncbi:ankyrin repeat domain-containing protein [archaeon]|nr:MAG: ankyrin repeat domain-containing protein [archaeon]